MRLRLLELHRRLLESERIDLGRFEGRMSGAEFRQVAADSLRLARSLFAPPDPETPFGRRCLRLLQRRPKVAVAHGALVEAVGAGGH